MALDTEKINRKIIKEAERFLREKGYDNPERVDFVEFSRYCSKVDFVKGDEINLIEIGVMRFDQVYGITKDGACIYVATIR